MNYRILIPPFVEKTIAVLPPPLKRKIRAALDEIQEDPRLGKPLEDKLKGLWSYRVSRYRIVYRIHHSRIEIQVLEIGPRSMIYERVIELIKRLKKS